MKNKKKRRMLFWIIGIVLFIALLVFLQIKFNIFTGFSNTFASDGIQSTSSAGISNGGSS